MWGWAETRGRADASKGKKVGSASARPRLGALETVAYLTPGDRSPINQEDQPMYYS